VINTGPKIASFAGKIISQISGLALNNLTIDPQIISTRDILDSMNFGVTKYFKNNTVNIAYKAK
jgi:hypothetical protein